jgi:NADPH:quinone reductase-like Zn-dependent oxidoreductase
MKAIVLKEAGGVDKLIYADIEKPVLKSGEILVKTKAIGMNPMDVFIRGTAMNQRAWFLSSMLLP